MGANRNILTSDLRNAWSYAVRALNCCENEDMKDSRQAMLEIVGRLSQQLEFHDVMNANELPARS